MAIEHISVPEVARQCVEDSCARRCPVHAEFVPVQKVVGREFGEVPSHVFALRKEPAHD